MLQIRFPWACWLAMAVLCLFGSGPVTGAGPAAVEVELREGPGGGFYIDDGSRGGRCLAADLTRDSGALPEITTSPLPAGVYRARFSLKLSHTIDKHVARLGFKISAAAHGKMFAAREFNIISVERPGRYQSFPLEFALEGKEETAVTFRVSFHWRAQQDKRRPVFVLDAPEAAAGTIDDVGEEDETLALERRLVELPWHMAVDRVSVQLLGSGTIAKLMTDKVRYHPEETAVITGALHNPTNASRQYTLMTEFVYGCEETVRIDSRKLTVPARGRESFSLSAKLGKRMWGYEVRCRLLEKDAEIHRRSDYFTVHTNPWAVAIGAYGVNLPYYRAGPKGEKADAFANAVRRGHGNIVEFVFWAPDDFGGLNPTETPYWSGQMRHQSGALSTRKLIEALHRRGIASSFYALFTVADGKAGYELYRKHPDWFTPQFYDVAQFDRWDRSKEMISWPQLRVQRDTREPYLHHAREIIRSIETFGWDAIRYDSDMSVKGMGNDQPHVALYFPIVKQMVLEKHPHFQWGYNDALHRRDLSKEPELAALFRTLCAGGGMIMDEYNVHGFKDRWTWEKFARRHVAIRDMVNQLGGHFVLCPSDADSDADSVYQTILPLAARAHHAWDPHKGRYPYADYHVFSNRYAGYLWDESVLRLKQAGKRITWKTAAGKFFKWQDYVYLRRRPDKTELIMHLVNNQSGRIATRIDGYVPEPIENSQCEISLPPGLEALSVWYATAEPRMRQQRIPHRRDGSRLIFAVDKLRFWNLLVVELRGKGDWE